MIHLSFATLFSIMLLTPLAHAVDPDSQSAAAQLAAIEPGSAGHHDLVFGIGKADEPFFKDGVFMLGDKIIKVEQGPLPDKKMVSFDEKANRIVVSNDKSLPEADKGAALLQLMDAMSIQQIEPAAGP